MEENCRTGARSRCYLADKIRFLQLHLPCFFKIDQVCGMFHMPRRGAARSKSVCGTRTENEDTISTLLICMQQSPQG